MDDSVRKVDEEASIIELSEKLKLPGSEGICSDPKSRTELVEAGEKSLNLPLNRVVEAGEIPQKWENCHSQSYTIRLRDLALEGTLRVSEPVTNIAGESTLHWILDKRCLKALNAHPTAKTFSDFPSRPKEVKRLLRHPLAQKLHETLLELNLPTVVLSISGGVDSTTHLALLWAVKQLADFQLAALHISRESGESAAGRWVAHTCSELGIPLYIFRSPLRRPRGGVDTGLTRNDYERAAAEARFCMYKRIASKLGWNASGWVAIVAHHQDDVDENRILNLVWDKRLHIDGMRHMCVRHGVTVLRPLLNVRKAKLVELATQLPLCYIFDAPPCMREWVRHAIRGHWFSSSKKKLLELLSRAGRLSEKADIWLEEQLEKWKEVHVSTTLPFKGPSKNGHTTWACGIKTGLLDGMALVPQLKVHLRELENVVVQIADIWNPAIAAMKIAHGSKHEELKNESLASLPHFPLCPIVAPRYKEKEEIGLLIFRKAMRIVEVDSSFQHLLKDEWLQQKALYHLWTRICRIRKGSLKSSFTSGNLSRSLHYVYSADDRFLTLLSISENNGMAGARNWKQRVAKTLFTQVSKSSNPL